MTIAALFVARRGVYSRNKSRSKKDDPRPRLTKREASATPIAFRDALLALARSVQQHKEASA